MPFWAGTDNSLGRARLCLLSFVQYDSPVRWVILYRPCPSGVPSLLGCWVLHCSRMLVLDLRTLSSLFSVFWDRLDICGQFRHIHNTSRVGLRTIIVPCARRWSIGTGICWVSVIVTCRTSFATAYLYVRDNISSCNITTFQNCPRVDLRDLSGTSGGKFAIRIFWFPSQPWQYSRSRFLHYCVYIPLVHTRLEVQLVPQNITKIVLPTMCAYKH